MLTRYKNLTKYAFLGVSVGFLEWMFNGQLWWCILITGISPMIDYYFKFKSDIVRVNLGNGLKNYKFTQLSSNENYQSGMLEPQ